MSSTDENPTVGLARLWSGYAGKVYRDYPLYVALAGAVASDPELLDRLAELPGTAHDPNLLLAALQYLVLGRPETAAGPDGSYAEMYGRPLDPPADAAERLHDYAIAHWPEIAELTVGRHVQTNETGRCGGLAVGLAAAAAEIGQPLGVIDDGASAGLNLSLDEYRIDFGPAGWTGPADSPVRIECRLESEVPPELLSVPPIAARLGIDRAPVDVGDPDAVRWMLACVWPGRGRQERARAALTMAAAHPGRVRKGDMVADLGAAIEAVAPHPTVVITSWSYSYLGTEARSAFQDVLLHHSARPIGWLCLDLAGTEPMFDAGPHDRGEDGDIPSVLGLAVFEGGAIRQARALAFIHSHGSWMRWLGEQ